MKTIGKTGFALLALLIGSTGWGQSVFTKYGPVAGIQKSTGATYQNTAAASSDITTLFGCTTPGQFLNQAGGCTVPAGTGVTSVAQTVPAGFAVTGSPVTGSGTLAISYATGQTANRVLATPDGTTGALSLRALVAGDIPPINLGSTANGGVSSATILLGTNGGTSNGFFSVTGPTTALRTFTFPNASATVLTTNAAVTVPQGGTGLATLTANGVLLGEGTSNVSPLVMGADTVLRGTASADPVAAAVPNCGSSTTALNYNTTTHAFGCQTITGGGTPGGATTNVQFNSSGVLAGDSGLTYAGSGAALSASGGVILSGTRPTINPSNSGIYMGGTTGGTPQFAMVNSSGAANSKVWDIFASATDMQFRLDNDAISSATTWLDVTRSGTTISTISFGAPVTINGTGPQGNFISTSAGAAAASYIAFFDNVPSRKGYVGSAGADSGSLFIESDLANIDLLPLTTTGKLQLSYDGGGSYQSVPRGARQIIWGAVSANGTGCTILASGSLTGACTRTAQGNYSIGSTGATNNMGCTASPTFTPSNAARAAGITGATSSITVAVYNAAGTAVDDNFQFVCMTQ